jgi:hypothetical protein
MDAPQFNGSDNRDDLAPDYLCEGCGTYLFSDEIPGLICRRCEEVGRSCRADEAYDRAREDDAA